MENFILTEKEKTWFGSFPALSAAGFLNACSCRLHGESSIKEGLFNLALHVDDDAELVLRNRKKFAQVLGVDEKKFTTCAQVHGSHVVKVDENLVGRGAFSQSDTIMDADALITNLKNVPLLLFYADCTPVLLVDPVTKSIGLAHAGWRGSVAKIAQKTLQAMEKAYGAEPQNILAGIGPSIGSCCYEVDDFVREKARGYEEFFAPVKEKNGHYMLDLWGLNRGMLEEMGVLKENIFISGICTADNAELFCSYRSEKGVTGRMGVCLMIEE